MHSAISYYAENITFSLKKKKIISAWLKEIVKSENKALKSISIIFCNDSFLLDINKRFLNHNTLTDTITFDYNYHDEISGDIFISVDRVKVNAKKFKNSFIDELYRVICHGVLHLTGHTDDTYRERLGMRAKEDYYLLELNKRLNVPRETFR